jgi:hypothetical protein
MTTAFLESEIEQRAALRVPWQQCVYKVHNGEGDEWAGLAFRAHDEAGEVGASRV